MTGERGQTTVEWTALVLLASVAFGALISLAGPRIDGRSFGGFLTHSIACAVTRDCRAETDGLAAVHGARDADLLRRYAPGIVYEPGTYVLPVDPRQCRAHACADAPDDPDLDAHRSRRGDPATAFTHVARKDGSTYLQYWLYYPDSTSTVANAAGAWNKVLGPGYPGYHPDDWESYMVRIDPSGDAFVRASSHYAYQGCKQKSCRNEWTPLTGWTRVSRGSHAGHIPLDRRGGWDVSLERGLRRVPYTYTPRYPGVHMRERTTSAAGLRLVPVKALVPGDLGYEVTPPWRKKVFRDPTSNSTG